MLDKNISKEMYFLFNQILEKQNEEYLLCQGSKEYRLGSFLYRIRKCVKSFKWRSILGFFRKMKWDKINNKVSKNNTFNKNDRPEFNCNDYFLNDRIAIYTSVFGAYDVIQEPNIVPNNIDYYIITDQDLPSNTSWRKIKHDHLVDPKLSNSEKNRYFKMHPDILFPEYKYSIYIDGNIKVISDLTPYVKLLGRIGLGFHFHNQRNCAYTELSAIELAHKAKHEDIISYQKYLKANNFPANYGLLECNVIVREHNNPICKLIMSEWWNQFLFKIQRDQVSLPFVLFKNNIRTEEIAVLGTDVYKNYSFRIVKHS